MAKKAEKEVYTYERHRFYQSKTCGKQVCENCGLVGLRNKATDWCIEKGCNYKIHPQHKATMLRLTRTFLF